MVSMFVASACGGSVLGGRGVSGSRGGNAVCSTGAGGCVRWRARGLDGGVRMARERRGSVWKDRVGVLRMSETGDVEFEPDAQYVAKLLACTVGLAAIASLAGLKPPLPLLIPPLLSAITLVKKPELDLSTLKTRGGMNSELLAPAGVAAGCKPPPSGTAKVYPVDKQTLKDRFLRVIAAQPRTVLSVVSQDKETYGFVARSLLMQYPDLVTVSFLDVEPGQSSTLAIYSQSIYGQGDLGANKKRVTEWLAALDKEL